MPNQPVLAGASFDEHVRGVLTPIKQVAEHLGLQHVLSREVRHEPSGMTGWVLSSNPNGRFGRGPVMPTHNVLTAEGRRCKWYQHQCVDLAPPRKPA